MVKENLDLPHTTTSSAGIIKSGEAPAQGTGPGSAKQCTVIKDSIEYDRPVDTFMAYQEVW